MPEQDQGSVAVQPTNITNQAPAVASTLDFLSEASQELSQERSTEQVAPQPVTGEDTTRYQYWQSQYDKMRSKNEETEQKIAKFQSYQPVIDYLSSNPDAVKMIDQQTNKGKHKPEMPKKPEYYDPSEAVTNPASESFKYRQQVDLYRDNLAEYLDTRYSQIEEREAETARGYQEQQARINSQREVSQYLVAEHGMQESEVSDFINVMGSKESLSPMNLVKFYKFLKGEVAQPQANVNVRRGNIIAMPVPIGVASGQGNPTQTDDQMFGESFLPTKRRGL